MSSYYFGKRRTYNRYALLSAQQKAIESRYPFLHCRIINNVLCCTGWIALEDCSAYKVKIEYVAGHEPKTTILYPIITPSREIHMYDDHSICLHYSPDMVWNEKVQVYKYTLPWISEWILFYEIYLITGKWEGKESPVHITDADKNINQEIN
jgi:hypothetical protein